MSREGAETAPRQLNGALVVLAGNSGEGELMAGLTSASTLELQMRPQASLGTAEGSRGNDDVEAPSIGTAPEAFSQRPRLGKAGRASATRGGGGAPVHPSPA